MDPVTTAIIAATTAGAAAGLTETAKTAIADAYSSLKTLLVLKFGENSEIVKAVANVEADADYQPILEGKVKKSGAEQDSEILAAATKLYDRVNSTPAGNKILQNVTGEHNIVVAGSGNTITVNNPDSKKK